VAQGAEQRQAGLFEVEAGIECFDVLLALVDPGLLLGLGRWLRSGSGLDSCSVAGFELGLNCLELLGGYLLFQTRNFCHGIKLADISGERGDLYIVLALGLFGFGGGAQGFGGGFAGSGPFVQIEERNLDREAGAEVVGLWLFECSIGGRPAVIQVVVIQRCRIAAIDCSESYLRANLGRFFIAFGLEVLGLGFCSCRFDA